MKRIFEYFTHGKNFLLFSFGTGFILIAISISYALIIKPITRDRSLDKCLNAVQEQIKRLADQTPQGTTTSLYERFLQEKTNQTSGPHLSVKDIKEAKETCYTRYK